MTDQNDPYRPDGGTDSGWNAPGADRTDGPRDTTPSYGADPTAPAYDSGAHGDTGRATSSGSSAYGSPFPESSYSATTPASPATPGQTFGQPSYGSGAQPAYGQAAQPTYGAPTYGDPAAGGAYGQPGHPYATLPKGLAITALVLGILSLLGFWFPVLAALLGGVAIVLGFLALRKVKNGTGGGRGLAIAGIVTGVLGVLANLIATVLMGAVFSEVMKNGDVQRAMECTKLPTQAEQQACLDQVSQELDRSTDAPGT